MFSRKTTLVLPNLMLPLGGPTFFPMVVDNALQEFPSRLWYDKVTTFYDLQPQKVNPSPDLSDVLPPAPNWVKGIQNVDPKFINRFYC